MFTLFFCYATIIGICGPLLEADFPTIEACERERVILMAAQVPPELAVCRPKASTPAKP